MLLAFLLLAARQQRPAPPWMIFVSDREGRPAVYRMNGSTIKRLTDNTGYYENPAWSPDGRWLIYTDQRAANHRVLMLRHPHSHHQFQLMDGFEDMGAPVWSPDGQWIAFAGVRENRSNIYRARPDGSDLQRLTFSEQYGNWSPAWSPDGQWIAFTRANERSSEIYRMRPDGSDTRQISSSAGDNWMPLWSPDGKWILFLSNRDSDVEIYRMKADGSEVQRIGQRPGYTWVHRIPTTWTENWIVLDIFRRGSWGSYRMKPDGTGLEAVPDLPLDNRGRVSLSWSPVVETRWRGEILLITGLFLVMAGAYWQHLS